MNPIERIDQLTKDLARVTAEREECRAFWTAEADKATTRTAELVRNSTYWEAEATALRAHIAELVAALRDIAGTPERDKDYAIGELKCRLRARNTLTRAESAAPFTQEITL